MVQIIPYDEEGHNYDDQMWESDMMYPYDDCGGGDCSQEDDE